MGGELLRRLDVFRLRALISAAQQHDQRATAPDKAEAIAGTVVNPQFADPLSYWRDISGIAERLSINPGDDFASGAMISEVGHPVRKGSGLTNFDRGLSVSYGIHIGKLFFMGGDKANGTFCWTPLPSLTV